MNFRLAFLPSFAIVLFCVTSPALADNPILEQYFDKTLPNYSSFKTLPTEIRYTDQEFNPTNLASMEDAQRLLVELKYLKKSYAECYQRAHLWALEMRQMANVRSEKVFLFFTNKYRRETGFDWWFHVAPFILVNGKEMVLDPYFFKTPVDIQTWSNFFMPSHPKCATVDGYQEFEKRTNSEDCIIRKVPQYYYQPLDVETRDAGGLPITDWIDYQVISAYESILPWWKR